MSQIGQNSLKCSQPLQNPGWNTCECREQTEPIESPLTTRVERSLYSTWTRGSIPLRHGQRVLVLLVSLINGCSCYWSVWLTGARVTGQFDQRVLVLLVSLINVGSYYWSVWSTWTRVTGQFDQRGLVLLVSLINVGSCYWSVWSTWARVTGQFD